MPNSTTPNADLVVIKDGGRLSLVATGAWTTETAPMLLTSLASASAQSGQAKRVSLDMTGINHLDTLGAWLLVKLSRAFGRGEAPTEFLGVPDRYVGLIEKVRLVNRTGSPNVLRAYGIIPMLSVVGEYILSLRTEATAFLEMLASVFIAIVNAIIRPRTFRLISAAHHLYRICWQAIPIVSLITFLIGCIIAQQAIFHFRKFGAEAYVVDMVGILVLREIGVLIVSIMVAGRSGSAYTAELGAMKMREEVDALRTMGVDPVDILILPRITALLIGLPILAFLGSMSALFGGGVVAWIYGEMSPAIFIARLHEAISITHFEVGIIKAPFMALVIGVVACSEGFRVKGSAESLGLQTTSSVVKSIFLVIVLDGIFAIFFASIGM